MNKSILPAPTSPLRLMLWALLIIPACLLSSCNDNNDLPDASFKIEEEGGVISDGILNIRQDDMFRITSVTLNPEGTTPGAMISRVNYFWDGFLVGQCFEPDFPMTFEIGSQKVGKHNLTIQAIVLAEGYTIAYYNTSYTVNVIPADADYGDYEPDDNAEFAALGNISVAPETKD